MANHDSLIQREEGAVITNEVANDSVLLKSPPINCKCSIFRIISENESQADSLVTVPDAATGYLDPVTGKQIGSFMTYVIVFKVVRFTTPNL